MQKGKIIVAMRNVIFSYISSTDWISDFKLRRRPTYKSKIDRQTDNLAADWKITIKAGRQAVRLKDERTDRRLYSV